MRIIDPAILAKLKTNQITAFQLIKLDISTPRYYTDCDVPITYDGHVYAPRSFDFDSANYSLREIVDSVRLKIDNINNDLTSDFIAGNPQGAEVSISVVALDDNDLSNIGGAAIPLFIGEIDEWSIEADDNISITLTSQFYNWNRRTLSNYSSSCRWKRFKGQNCRYTGPESACDRSYARCAELGNTANFGGFRWLPSIEGKEIWWGRTKG